MAKYYSEAVNRAAKKYKSKNIEQIGISFQRGQGIKESFQMQAEKKGVSVNKYVIDLIRADADGRVIVLPAIEKEDVSLIMQVIGQTAPSKSDASGIMEKMDEATREAVKMTAAAGGMSPEALISMIISSLSSNAAVGIARLLFCCLEANGADHEMLCAVFGDEGDVK